jgi:arginine repressor
MINKRLSTESGSYCHVAAFIQKSDKNSRNEITLGENSLKSVYGNQYVVILGAMGRPGNTAKLIDEKGKNLGVFKTLDSISGDDLRKIKGVKGNKMFDVYIFDKKI